MPAASPQVYRRRRLTALAVLVVAIVALALLVRALGGSSQTPASRASTTPTATPTPVQLPRGGRQILPNYRVVAYYGAPQDPQLGALGIGTPSHAVSRLEHQAAGYGRKTRPVLPALELIAVVAAG